MFRLLGLLCLFNITQASLQSYFDDIKGRTRWCLGEGQTCSLNLVQGIDFSLCCAPYVCTAITKTRKPNWLLSSEYKEYNCFLPSSFTLSSAFEDDVRESESHYSRPSEENEVHVEKRSINDSQLFVNIDSNSIEEIKANQSEDNINITSIANNSSEFISTFNITNSSMEILSDYGYNKSMQYSPEFSESSSELLGNVSDKHLQIMENPVEYQNTRTNSTFQNISSETFSEEDWHSSEMQYDTRPTLRKVVTVHPFHFFDTVKVIKINESIETSAE